MDREKIELEVDELQDIVYEDSEDYEVVKSEITGTFRHGNENSAIIKRISDNKYFEIYYRDSVKDGCDFQDLNFKNSYKEVFPVEKTITVYE